VAAVVLQLIKLPGFDTASEFDFGDPYSRSAPKQIGCMMCTYMQTMQGGSSGAKAHSSLLLQGPAAVVPAETAGRGCRRPAP
jgi:hypothetical protein